MYLGDFDPTGIHIDQVIMNQIDKEVSSTAELFPDIEIKRIALTEVQITKLPTSYQQANSRDPNYQEYISRYGTKIWGLEALTSKELSEIVFEVLNEYRPISKIEELRERDREEVK